MKLSVIERALIASICLMPFTRLKVIGPIGPSELLILYAFIKLLLLKNFKCRLCSTFISADFINYNIVAFVGTFANIGITIFSRTSLSGGFDSIVFDAFSYIFVLILLVTLEMYYEQYQNSDPNVLLKYVIYIDIALFLVLFIASKFTDSILGMPLMYYDYFAPLAKNLHHTSMYLLPLSFLTLYVASIQVEKIGKLVLVISSMFLMYLAISTGSTKASLGVIVGVAIVLFYFITTRNGVLNKRAVYTFLILSFCALILAIPFFDRILSWALDYFTENDLGGGRQKIWSTAIEKWSGSLLVGYGFGSHVQFGEKFWDAHNSLITALLQTGICGIIVLMSLWIKLLLKTSKNGYLLAANASIFIYLSGGDILRRIPCWAFMMLTYLIVCKNSSCDSFNLMERQ